MKRTSLHSLEPTSARKKIASAKSNKPFMAALLDRGHREHKEAVEQWTRLHEAAFPEPTSSAGIERKTPVGRAHSGASAISIQQDDRADERDVFATPRTSLRPIKSRLQNTTDAEGRGISADVPGGQANLEPPVVNMEADRIRVLLEDSPALFEIEDNPDADPNHGAWRASHTLGRNAVHRHEAIIEREAKAQGIDADLVKAIMYVENAQGLYGHFAEAIDQAESLFPMNIKPNPWAAIEGPPADLGDPTTNVRIAVTLIRRISERIDDPTIAEVATIWNFTGRESVNGFGERVRDVYENQVWKRPVLAGPDQHGTP